MFCIIVKKLLSIVTFLKKKKKNELQCVILNQLKIINLQYARKEIKSFYLCIKNFKFIMISADQISAFFSFNVFTKPRSHTLVREQKKSRV